MSESEDPTIEEEVTEEEAKRMSFTGHLGELRTRMVHTTTVIGVLFFVGLAFSGYTMTYIQSLVDVNLEVILEEELEKDPEFTEKLEAIDTEAELIPLNLHISTDELNAMQQQLGSDKQGMVKLKVHIENLRPLIHEQGKSPSEVSRKDEIFTANNGLISIAGGKLTAFRRMAQRIIDKIETTEKRFGSCKTAHIPLVGSVGLEVKGYKTLIEKLNVYTSKFQKQKNLIRLVHSYGNASFEMMDNATDDLSLIYTEIKYCVENESLEHLVDYYSRRSGKVLFASDELLETQSEILAHFSMLKGLSETQISKEKELIEQLKMDALGSS